MLLSVDTARLPFRPAGVEGLAPSSRLWKGQAIVLFSEKHALLVCSGDEDRSTQARRRRALSRSLACQTDVLVDLSGLVFADVTLMLDLAMVARRLRRAGRMLHLQSPQPQIRRLIEMMGLDRLAGVSVEPLGA